jgi:hypothetical protein
MLRRAGLVVVLGLCAAHAPRAEQAPALANPLAALSLDDLSATRERPLFSPTRRLPAEPPPAAPPPPVVAAPAPPAPVPTLALFGIIADAEGARAMVRTGASKDILRLRVGDTVESWTVARIGRTELVLQLGERTETVTLFAPNASQARPTAAAPGKPAAKVAAPPKMAVAPVLRSTPKNFESDGL